MTTAHGTPSDPPSVACTNWRQSLVWQFALMVWLIIAYPLSVGPVQYLYARGSLLDELAAVYSYPADAIPYESKLTRCHWYAWGSYWRRLGIAEWGDPTDHSPHSEANSDHVRTNHFQDASEGAR